MIVSYAQCCVSTELIATHGSLTELWVESDGGNADAVCTPGVWNWALCGHWLRLFYFFTGAGFFLFYLKLCEGRKMEATLLEHSNGSHSFSFPTGGKLVRMG